jgi:hypothetical protein
MKTVFCSFCGLLVAAAPIQAQTIAQWTFETSFGGISGTGTTLSGIVPEVGTGSASGVHLGAATSWSSPSGNGSSHSFNANTWAVGDYWQFQTTTVGYQNIRVSYDQTSSSSGPGKGILQYSTDGIAFTPVTAEYTILANGSPHSSWNMTTHNSFYTFDYDLSSISGLNNAASVFFRILDTQPVSADGGIVAAAGTDRVDNFTIAVVPEPQGLFLLAGLALFLHYRVRPRQHPIALDEMN